MFKLKETQANLAKARCDKVELEIENDRLKKKIATLEDNINSLQREIENEHLENYNQHRTLLAIKKETQGAYGNYITLLQKFNSIKKELSTNA